MAKRGAQQKIDPALAKAIKDLLKSTMDDKKASLTDKTRVIDRALKFEAIKAKIDDHGYGSEFGKTPDEPEDDE